MKKTITALFMLALVSCSKNFDNLKMNVDRPANVEAKIGKPDSVVREVFLNISKESWYYMQDSVLLTFRNDILVALTTPQMEREERNAAIKQMEEVAEAIADSVRASQDSIAWLEAQAAMAAEKEGK